VLIKREEIIPMTKALLVEDFHWKKCGVAEP
jgi:hypothetical protein